jgi:hypothetical protein
LAFEIAGIDAQAFQHPDQGLAGEDRAFQPIARAIQTNHQAITNKLIVAHPFHIHYILNADLGCGGRRNKTDRQYQGGKDFHEGLRYKDQVWAPLVVPVADGMMRKSKRKVRAKFLPSLNYCESAKLAGSRLSLPRQGEEEFTWWSFGA